MKGFKAPIQNAARANTDFRHVLYTSRHSQIVLMCLHPLEQIGMEVHPDNDQFFRFESGHGQCIIDGHTYSVYEGDAVVIPAGAKHNIINTNPDTPLKMYTIYSPAHHKDGIVRATKKEAEEHEAEFDGVTTE